MSDGKFGLFGRQYEFVGKESADFCIKTKGLVKVKWGKKYIDLIKDGKVNCDNEFINKVKDRNSVKGDDGIYVTDDGEVYLKAGDLIIPIYGDAESSMFVAYKEQLEKTGEERGIAQENIGLRFDTLEEFQKSGITNGIAFIVGEGKIYMMLNSVATPLDFKLPDPITYPIHIKLEGNNQYALYIEGYFSDNGSKLVIGKEDNGLFLFAEAEGQYIDATNKITIRVDGKDKIVISGNTSEFDTDIDLKNGHEVIVDVVKSHGGDVDMGYWLGMKNGESYLYVDNLYVRNGNDNCIHVFFGDLIDYMENGELEPDMNYCIDDFQNEWDIVDFFEEDNEQTEQPALYHQNVFPLVVTAKSVNDIYQTAYFKGHPEWKVLYDYTYQDLLCSYNETDEETGETSLIEVTAKGRIIRMQDEYNNICSYDFKHLRFWIDGAWKYTFGGDTDESSSGKYVNNTIMAKLDNIEMKSVENTQNINYTINENGAKISIQSGECKDNTFSGMTGQMTISNNSTINVRICSDDAKDIEITGDIRDSVIVSDVINGLELTDVFKDNLWYCTILENMKFYNTHNVQVNGGFSNCTFDAGVLQYNYFHSEFSGITFSGEPKFDHLYTSKVVDVYMNDGMLRLIHVPDTVFPGMIVMFNGGMDIPDCWAICDGSNGTPNLIDSFIKASTVVGETGDGLIKVENLPTDVFETEVDGEHQHQYVCPVTGWSDNANDRRVQESSTTTTTPMGGEHSHQFYLNKGEQVKFDPKFYSLIFIMYIGG